MKKNKCIIRERKIPGLQKLMRVMKLTSFIILISAISVFANKIYSQTSPEVQGSNLTDFQQNTVSGTVTDESGEPLPGVTIIVKGTTQGTVTNADGEYSLSNISENATLVFSFVGMLTQEVEVGNQSTLNITLIADAIGLDEVVVTALGITSKKKSLGYAVDNIGGEEIVESKEANVVNSLAGKVAGLKITPAASGAGGSSRVIIRGNASLTGNNQPLYVVDGIPINNSSFGSVSSNSAGPASVRSDYGSGINDINPDDIASISVLKGPNAAALYGSSASNGAIIITTKKGSPKKGLGVSYSGTYMVNTIHEGTLPQFQNEYGQGVGGTYAPDITYSWGAKLDGRAITYPSGIEGTYSAQPNNVKDYFNIGGEALNTVAIDNASEIGFIRFSWTNNSTTGVVPNSELTKNTFNLRAGTNLSDKLAFDSKITYFIQDADSRVLMGWDGSRNPTNQLYRMPRNADIKDYENYYIDEDGYSVNPVENTRPAGNPYYMQKKIVDTDKRQRILGMLQMTYTLNENFNVFARVGTDALSHKFKTIMPWGSDARLVKGKRDDSQRWIFSTHADFLATFNKELSSNFNVNLNGGGKYQYGLSMYSSRGGEDFKIPTSYLYSNLETLLAGNESSSRSSSYSLYFFGSFDYKEAVYLNFTGRNDWNSGLWTPDGSPSDWSYFYPSLSMSVLGNELLGIESNILSFSKLRLAWSQVGSGGNKNYQTYYYLGNTTGYNGLISVTQSNVYDDPELGPETTESKELGLELQFFNNRIYTDFSIYNSSTFDQIVNAPVDASTGFEFVRTNVGEISNKGFELLVGIVPVKNSNFTWDASVNVAKNTGTLEEFIEGSDAYNFGGRDGFSVKTKVGGNIGDIWGRDFVYHEGKMVVDANGLPVASTEEQLIGNYFPDLSGGFLNTFRYKNLNLKVLIDGQIGGKTYNVTSQETGRYGTLKRTLEGREGMTLDAWVNTGTAESPVYEVNSKETNAEAYWARLQGIEAAHMEDLTNIRLREVNLSYTIPSRLLSKTFINTASVSLIGRNLFFLVNKTVGADPESSVSTGNGQGYMYYNMPSLRRYGMSLNLSF
jgi:TonB-linked SusC/RagA family outer membrane protein